jgi:hypothetical protein
MSDVFPSAHPLPSLPSANLPPGSHSTGDLRKSWCGGPRQSHSRTVRCSPLCTGSSDRATPTTLSLVSRQRFRFRRAAQRGRHHWPSGLRLVVLWRRLRVRRRLCRGGLVRRRCRNSSWGRARWQCTEVSCSYLALLGRVASLFQEPWVLLLTSLFSRHLSSYFRSSVKYSTSDQSIRIPVEIRTGLHWASSLYSPVLGSTTTVCGSQIS